ncbi:MAG: LysR family transcriptional regulator [Micropruina sp.]|uniref:LysR family transcriptional regulator n=1 Tax=Micropruina sp. TaxID=2737536 RepID=UPI0039E501A6
MPESRFTLTQLRYFTEVAHAGSMTEAARRLHLSQPALSSAINQLEHDLGVQLFDRVPRRGVRLTSAGRQFHLDAVSLLSHAEGVRERVSNFSGSLTGMLRVGVYQPLAPFRTPTLIQAFARRHPGIGIVLLEADHDRLVAMLDEHEIDVALAYDIAPFERHFAEPLELVPPHMIVAPEHPLASSTGPVSLRRFANDPLVLFDLPHTAHYYLGLYRSVGVEPEIRYRIEGFETVRGLVGRGFGVALLNQRIGHDLTYGGGRVRELELEEDLPGLTLMLVRHRDDESQRVRAFAEVCRAHFAVPDPPI